MKKVLILFGIFIFYILVGTVLTESELIPNEAIRIRVIANSDAEQDQKLKLEIKEELEKLLYSKLKNIKGIEEAANIIKETIPEAKEVVYNILGNNNYEINYGMNYFPKKEYKGITYNEGYYEALVVTLGTGLGQNWWCVLFPPLCMLDNIEMEDVEYRSLAVDIINKYF